MWTSSAYTQTAKVGLRCTGRTTRARMVSYCGGILSSATSPKPLAFISVWGYWFVMGELS